jgi:hypothetical protein
MVTVPQSLAVGRVNSKCNNSFSWMVALLLAPPLLENIRDPSACRISVFRSAELRQENPVLCFGDVACPSLHREQQCLRYLTRNETPVYRSRSESVGKRGSWIFANSTTQTGMYDDEQAIAKAVRFDLYKTDFNQSFIQTAKTLLFQQIAEYRRFGTFE